MNKFSSRLLLVFIAVFFVVQPASASVCLILTKSLSKGSENNEVLKLQQFLFENEYLATRPNGYFGPMTVVGVRKFQLANGLTQTGSIGPMTRNKIREMTCATSGNVSTISTSTSAIARSGNEQTVTLDATTFLNGYPTLSGSATGLSAFSLSVSERTGNRYTKYGNSHIEVIGGKWKIKLSTSLVDGSYDVEFLTDKYGKRLSNSVITIKRPKETTTVPYCSLSTDRIRYNYGEDVKISWTTKNAEFMTFYFDRIASGGRYAQSRISIETKDATGLELIKPEQYDRAFTAQAFLNRTNKEIVEPLKIVVSNADGESFCTTTLNIAK